MNPNNVAYLAALVSVSEEVRLRCHVKHQFGDMNSAADPPLVDNIIVDNHLIMLSVSGASSPVQPGPTSVKDLRDLPVNQRQKSLEVMDQSAMTAARMVRSPGTPGSGGRLKERSMSMPTRPASQAGSVPVRSEPETTQPMDLRVPGLKLILELEVIFRREGVSVMTTTFSWTQTFLLIMSLRYALII